MRIKCLTTFLDGRTLFEKDDRCTVPDDDGARFCANGWAEDLGDAVATDKPAAGSTDLDIANVRSIHSSNTAGA